MNYLSLIQQFSFNQKIALSVVVFFVFLNTFTKLFSSRPYLSALFHLPGTILHELAHFFIGLILFAKPIGFSLIPKKEGNSLTLGSVSFVNINFFNAIPTAFAPLLLLLLGVFLILNLNQIESFFLVKYNISEIMFLILFGYILYSCVSSSLPSSQDFLVAFSSPLGIAFYFAFIYYFFTRKDFILNYFNSLIKLL